MHKRGSCCCQAHSSSSSVWFYAHDCLTRPMLPPPSTPQDYFEFEAGNARAGAARGVRSETQAAIDRWLQANQ
jgi:hypothetical protein